jgi:hypothetical protein
MDNEARNMRNIQMNAHQVFDQPFPPPEEIQAAVRRAHWERSQALRRLLIALFSLRKQERIEATHSPALKFAGHC